MRTAVQRWGNSLALRIPRAFAEETRLSAGTAIDLAVNRGRLVVTLMKKKYRLADLVKDIKPAQLHREQFTDGSIGKEFW